MRRGPEAAGGVVLVDLIRRGLEKLGTPITELAAVLDVDRSFLNKLKNGGHPPRTQRGEPASRDPRYRKLADALDIDPGEFTAAAEAEQCAEPLASPEVAARFRAAMGRELRLHLARDCETAEDLLETTAAFIDSALVPSGVRRLAWRIRGLPPAHAVVRAPRFTSPGASAPRRFAGEPRDGRPGQPASLLSERCLVVSEMCLRIPAQVPDEYRSAISDLFKDLATRKIESWDAAVALAANLGPPAR